MDQEEFRKMFSLDAESALAVRSYTAMLNYETNAMKYDVPGKPTFVPHNERMNVYALHYRTTVEEMKKYRNDVEKILGIRPNSE